jgi:hypothetical protein
MATCCVLCRGAWASQEFGTTPAMAVAAALVQENAGYHSGDGDGGRRAYADYLTWVFYPQRLGEEDDAARRRRHAARNP